ncbi:nucleoplasmin-2 isoform X3 [Felis catus]|uniref:nucleoplasmin-2 isoform X3 n=1 Tax=Felis catus TaxID=9685 RepID=UPI001D1A27D6|nr:nucleoplasmin-2 isoform X3 [Felis catus]
MRAGAGNRASPHGGRPFLTAAGTPAPAPRVMNRSSTSSAAEKAPTAMLWGCELNQEKRTWTVKPQKEGKQDCKLLLSTVEQGFPPVLRWPVFKRSQICLGEKAKEEMNLVEILPPASQEDKKAKPITIASLQASVLPMVMMGLELSPPVTFQLRAGSGPVFLSGQECYDTSDLSWEEEEEEDDLEEEEEEEDDSDDDDDDDVDVDVSLEEETPLKQVKRLASQKQTGVAKKKKVEKEEEAVRPSLKDKSPVKKAKPTLKPKKPGSKK